jgi:hypothetical protein
MFFQLGLNIALPFSLLALSFNGAHAFRLINAPSWSTTASRMICLRVTYNVFTFSVMAVTF